MSDKIKRLNRELVYKGSILDIYKDTMDVGNGKIEEWDFVAHRKGAACIVPVLPDGKILMVRQYRNALERDTLEIPAGARNDVTEDMVTEELGMKVFLLTNDLINREGKDISRYPQGDYDDLLNFIKEM